MGLGLHLSGSSTPSGAQLENPILHDLLAWRETLPRRAAIIYRRTLNGEDVDFVVDTTEHLLAIEVKATTNPRISDAANLGVFLHEYADRNAMALLLHTGDAIEGLAPKVLAVPWWRVI